MKKVTLIPQDMPFLEFKRTFSETKQHYFPVVDGEKRLVGIFSVNDIRGVLFSPEIEQLVVMKDVGTSEIIVTTPDEDLKCRSQKIHHPEYRQSAGGEDRGSRDSAWHAQQTRGNLLLQPESGRDEIPAQALYGA